MDKAKVMSDKYEFLNENYVTVTNTLKEWGFTNIKQTPLNDIVLGITAEGSVGSVTINGTDSFGRGNIFKKDVEVIVTYHMKQADDPSNTQPSSSQSQDSAPTEQTEDIVIGTVEELDLDAINATNSADSDTQFVGKTYRVKGIVGEAAPPDEIVKEAAELITADRAAG